MLQSLQDLTTGLIDYAGTFPPAALDMASAVRNYAAYRQGKYAGMLGRFIVPVAGLEEFERAAVAIAGGGKAWRLSVLAGDGLDSDLKKIDNFNGRNLSGAFIDSLEIKVAHYRDIEESMKSTPETLHTYFEIPIADDPTHLVKAVSAAGARAKVRTGGVTTAAFPSSSDLARFIKACAEEDVPFKATAGLHHPLRSINKLTYEANSGHAIMHGFLNLLLAAAFAYNGMNIDDLIAVLEERSPASFQFEDDSVSWRGKMLVRGQLRNARSLLALSFGACSFEEPIEGLQKMVSSFQFPD
ncbi:MAG: hypothetical protein J2P31_08340 [Blastocatellia bacterium]|nr:hypothetical protein [Blastocatellia bacterium]